MSDDPRDFSPLSQLKARLRDSMRISLDDEVEPGEKAELDEELDQCLTLGALFGLMGGLSYDAPSAITSVLNALLGVEELKGEELDRIPTHWDT